MSRHRANTAGALRYSHREHPADRYDDSDSDVAATASAPSSPSFPELPSSEEAKGKNSDGRGALSADGSGPVKGPFGAAHDKWGGDRAGDSY